MNAVTDSAPEMLALLVRLVQAGNAEERFAVRDDAVALIERLNAHDIDLCGEGEE